MKNIRLLFCAYILLTIAACGGSDTGENNRDGAAADASGNGVPDAGGNGVPDAGGTDAGGTMDGGSEGVLCGSTVCDSTQECCVDGADPICVDSDMCDGMVFGCDGPEDCTTAGEVCCTDQGQNGSQCQPQAACPTTVCQVPEDCPVEGDMCCTVGMVNFCAATCPSGP